MSGPEHLDLLIDLHLRQARQGPGSPAATERAIELSGLVPDPALRLADIGCGTGAAALVLAARLDAQVTAVDLFPAFLEECEARAARPDLSGRIRIVEADMQALPFEEGSLDAIFAEGAVYNIGFERGVREWRRFLRPGGVLAVSELVWLTGERPDDIDAYWNAAYPEIGTAGAKMAQLEEQGYSPLGYFPLPESCWLDHYYRPLEAAFDDFLTRHDHADKARALVQEQREEIALYDRFSAFFGYGYFIARKRGD